MSIAELQQIAKHYPTRGRRGPTLAAVDGVDLRLTPGRTLGLVGESGSGKSTIARLLLRLVPPTSGRVILDGTDITDLRGERLRAYRGRMQMVFQDPYSSFDPLATISDSIGEALRNSNVGGALRRSRTEEVLEQVRLSPNLMDRHPGQLSGGQLQRAAIARALAIHPELIALDEAVSSLDVSTQAQIINLLADLQEQTGISYLFISHNLAVVRHLSHEIAVMYLGRIVEAGPAASIYSEPKHPYTQALLSAMPVAHPTRQRARKRIMLTGEMPSASKLPTGCRFRNRCPSAMPVCAEVDPPAFTSPDGHRVYCHLYDSPQSGSGVTPETVEARSGADG
jgi:oligopeptide/dipeptide ABC transporter ATP-binding protein